MMQKSQNHHGWMKILSLMLLLVSAALLLCGCTADEVTGEQPREELVVIGLSQVGAESDWRVANSESMKRVLSEQNGYRLLFDDARQIQENQIMAIRKFIQQKVDYIVLLPLSETGWDSVLKEARDAGIPVILVDRMVSVEDESLYTAHVGSDFLAQGQRAVEWMEQQYGASDAPLNIVHIQGTIGSTAQIGRTAALDQGVEKHPNWRIITRLDGDFTQAKSFEVMNRYLDTLPAGQTVDVIYCENDNEAFGAIEALEAHGYVCGRDVDVICFDATRRALEMCMEGRISVAVECNPLLGPLAESIVQCLERGETPPRSSHVEEQVFTRDMLTEELIRQREY